MMRMTIALALLTSGVISAAGPRRDLYGDPLPAGALMRLGTTRFRHGGHRVMGVAYSPDGNLLATSGADDLIRIWDAQTGAEFRRLAGHTDTPIPLAFSPNGKLLASGGEDDTVRLWDVAGGKLLHTIKEEGALFSVVFSHDGKCVASSSGDKRIRLWDTATGQCLRTLEGHKEGDNLLSLSPDGKWLASASWRDGMICLWDMASGKLVRECGRRLHKVHRVRFAPDGKTLATCDGDGLIHLWDAATGNEVRRWRADESEVQTVAFTENGRKLLSCGEKGAIREWDVTTGKKLRVLARHLGTILELSLSPDSKTLASVSWDSVVRRWDLASGKEITPFNGHEAAINSVRFADDDRTLISAGEDGTVRIWDVTAGKELRREGEKVVLPEEPPQIALSPDVRTLAESREEIVRLRNLATGKVLASFPTSTPVKRLLFSADGKTLAVGTDGDIVRGDVIHLWDVRANKERCRLSGLWLLAFSADGRLLAAPDANRADGPHGGIHLWESGNGKEALHIPRPDEHTLLYPLCFSADGHMLAGWGHNPERKAPARGVVVVWEVATGKERFRLRTEGDEILAATFSPDSSILSTAGTKGKLYVWDVRTGAERETFGSDQGDILTLAFSHDGRKLASGGQNTTILLWSLAAPTLKPIQAVKELSIGEWRALWTHLAGEDAARAFQAMKTFHARPAGAVAFLSEQLRSLVPADTKTGKQCLADLDSNELARRERAVKRLEKLGDSAEPLLRQALRDNPSLELRRRAEGLLEKLAAETPERLRTRRALEVLEWLNTPESRRLLDELARGAPGAWLTREAKAALERRATPLASRP